MRPSISATLSLLLSVLLTDDSSLVLSFIIPSALSPTRMAVAYNVRTPQTFLASSVPTTPNSITPGFPEQNATFAASADNNDGTILAGSDSDTNASVPISPALEELAANDVVFQSLERKEAQLDKKLESTMAQLSALEQSLNAVKSQKQLYLNGLHLKKTPPGGIFTETALRSAVKAFAWRIIAGSVTFVTSLRFSGSVMTALTLVGTDFFSKAATMFIGERIMNKSSAGRKSGADNAGRSLVKALIWRLFAVANTLTMAIFIAKDLSVASKIAGIDAIFKTALMFFYERAWAGIAWGKEFQVEFAI